MTNLVLNRVQKIYNRFATLISYLYLFNKFLSIRQLQVTCWTAADNVTINCDNISPLQSYGFYEYYTRFYSFILNAELDKVAFLWIFVKSFNPIQRFFIIFFLKLFVQKKVHIHNGPCNLKLGIKTMTLNTSIYFRIGFIRKNRKYHDD